MTLYGLEGCVRQLKKLTERAVRAAETFRDHAFLAQLAQELARRTH